jgi:hypothetical protein
LGSANALSKINKITPFNKCGESIPNDGLAKSSASLSNFSGVNLFNKARHRRKTSLSLSSCVRIKFPLAC